MKIPDPDNYPIAFFPLPDIFSSSGNCPLGNYLVVVMPRHKIIG